MLADDAPTVELPRCRSCGLPVEPGKRCNGCGVRFVERRPDIECETPIGLALGGYEGE